MNELIEVPVPGMKVVPDYFGTPEWEVLFGGAWIALCKYLLDKPEAVAAFAKDTGFNLEALIPRSPLEAMIDQACGRRKEVFASWCDWVTKNHWGEAQPPPSTERIKRNE